MNEALMKHVERAVRPVCAGWQRKLALREEMLAHLTAIYEEELLRSGNEQAALAQAKARFGEPAELSRELQRSLSSWQRLDARVARFLEPYLEPGMGLASALLILLTGIFWWSVAYDLTSWWANLPRLALPMLLLLPPLIVWCAWLIEKSRLSREALRRWTMLELDS